MNNDFRKFATHHLGINGMVLDDVAKVQQQYLNPYILEVRCILAFNDGPYYLLGYPD